MRELIVAADRKLGICIEDRETLHIKDIKRDI